MLLIPALCMSLCPCMPVSCSFCMSSGVTAVIPLELLFPSLTQEVTWHRGPSSSPVLTWGVIQSL